MAAMLSKLMRFQIEERVRRQRAQGPIDPMTLASEITAALPNYRHLRKQIVALVLKTATAINCREINAQFADITSRFVPRRSGRPRGAGNRQGV